MKRKKKTWTICYTFHNESRIYTAFMEAITAKDAVKDLEKDEGEIHSAIVREGEVLADFVVTGG